MGSNKDQLQAHQFMLQRVVSALTVQETDPEQPPFRRPTIAAISGIVIAVLSLVAVWVYGLVVPGGNQFTATDVIAVEKETGARFVLMNGQLHPVLNYTSALLAIDRHAEVRMVSHDTLVGIPAGLPIGIPDAPDSLPDKGHLLTTDWSMCSHSVLDDQGQRQETAVMLVGHTPQHWSSLGARAMLAQSGRQVFLIYRGYRYEVTAGVKEALQLGGETIVPVTGAWLDSVPAGDPIAPIPVGNPGQPSSAVPGLNLLAGQLVRVGDGGDGGSAAQYYLVQQTQLRPITPLQEKVQVNLDPHAKPVVEVDSGVLVKAHVATADVAEDTTPPRVLPQIWNVDDPDSSVCASFRPSDLTPQILVSATLSTLDQAAPAAGDVHVAVPPGEAVLVEDMAAPKEQAGQGTIGLVTAQGRFYPLADPPHVLQVLGYDGAPMVRMTTTLVSRIPVGHPLSPTAARVPVSGGGG